MNIFLKLQTATWKIWPVSDSHCPGPAATLECAPKPVHAPSSAGTALTSPSLQDLAPCPLVNLTSREVLQKPVTICPSIYHTAWRQWDFLFLYKSLSFLQIDLSALCPRRPAQYLAHNRHPINTHKPNVEMKSKWLGQNNRAGIWIFSPSACFAHSPSIIACVSVITSITH